MLVAVLASTALGCGTLRDLVRARGIERQEARYALVGGRVSEAKGSGAHWLVVFVATVPCSGDFEAFRAGVEAGAFEGSREDWGPETRALDQRLLDETEIVQHNLVQGEGTWYVQLPPGCYGVGAFADRNGNYRYDDDEPAALVSADARRVLRLGEGDRVDGVDLVIPEEGRLPRDPLGMAARFLETRTHREQLHASLDSIVVAGEVVDLADPHFGAESGHLGYWDPVDFEWRQRPGVYFLEPYEPDKVPVLFVHGALGYPQEFATLIDSLDRSRFQPWFYFYPSGTYLASASGALVQLVMRLQLRYGFDEMAVVAHSMGGLVARSFVLDYHEHVREDPIRLFVSISTPWAGMDSAREGVDGSPIVVPSWRDVATGSPFLHALFFDGQEPAAAPDAKRRPLPANVHYNLLFGVKDDTIGLDTATRWEALRDAGERWPLPHDHTSILRGEETRILLNELLDRAFD